MSTIMQDSAAQTKIDGAVKQLTLWIAQNRKRIGEMRELLSDARRDNKVVEIAKYTAICEGLQAQITGYVMLGDFLCN